MAIVTTPGAADADSFASYAEYVAYCTARGITPSIEATAELELRKAASYLVNQYRDKWIGIRANETQSLPWPRVEGFRGYAGGVIQPLLDSDGFEIPYDSVPLQIKNAQIEVALLIKGGVNMEPRLERGGMIKSIGKSVGPLRKDITYMDGAPSVDRFLAIEGLLRGLVTSVPGSTSGNVRLVRS